MMENNQSLVCQTTVQTIVSVHYKTQSMPNIPKIIDLIIGLS